MPYCTVLHYIVHHTRQYHAMKDNTTQCHSPNKQYLIKQPNKIVFLLCGWDLRVLRFCVRHLPLWSSTCPEAISRNIGKRYCERREVLWKKEMEKIQGFRVEWRVEKCHAREKGAKWEGRLTHIYVSYIIEHISFNSHICQLYHRTYFI